MSHATKSRCRLIGAALVFTCTVAGRGAADVTVIHVDGTAPPGGDGLSWQQAHRYLQDGLAHADVLRDAGPVEVHVAQGDYTPDLDEAGAVTPGDRDASFHLLDGVAVMGGFAGRTGDPPTQRDVVMFPTVLSGDLAGDDELYFVNVEENSYHVVTARGTGATAVLEGVTVSGGNTVGLDGGGLQEYLENGGGVFCWDGSPTLRSCTFTRCRAIRGGAIYANGETWHDGELTYVAIAPTIIDCRFTINYSLWYGGAVALNVSGLTMRGCDFDWNETTGVLGGGALSLRHAAIDGSEAVIHNSRFVGNFASYPEGGVGGAIRIVYVPTQISSTLLADNTAEGDGGALHVSPLTYAIELRNCTMAGNRSVHGNGGGMRVTGFNVTVDNSILWGNEHGGPTSVEQYGQLSGPAETTVSDSCVEDWSGQYAGERTFGADPLFADPDGPDGDPSTWTDNDYRLAAGSPCIDAGDNGRVPADVTDLDDDGDTDEPAPLDLDGHQRFVDDPDQPDTGVGTPPLVDIGAYERPGPPCPADANGDGAVDADDLVTVILQWGPCEGCGGDVTGDGTVGADDLVAVIQAWGSCG
jgi:hypothetical protein